MLGQYSLTKIVSYSNCMYLILLVGINGFLQIQGSGQNLYLLALLCAADGINLLWEPGKEPVEHYLRRAGELGLAASIYVLAEAHTGIFAFGFYILRVAPKVNRITMIGHVAIVSFLYLAAVSGLMSWPPQTYEIIWIVFALFIFWVLGMVINCIAYLERRERSQRQKIEDLLAGAQETCRAVNELAVRDELTGLYNYRAFQSRILEMQHGAFALLLLDIDYFKALNDQFGHLLGDQILRKLAEIIERNVRRDGCVFRYGGEEFAVLLKQTSLESARVIAEDIREDVEKFSFDYDGVLIQKLTVSIGIAVNENGILNPQELFAAADNALYTAKNAGRNRIICV